MTATPFAPNARAWDLDHLRVFSLVARRASFVAAATELGMSPAYVSKRVAELERALGVVLFHRTTRRVLISEAGEAALGWSQRVLEAADRLQDSVALTSTAAGPDGQPLALSGPLRISTSLRLGRHHVSPILAELQAQHPGLEIWLELLDRRVDLLAEGFDIDIRMGEVAEPHLIAHPVARNARVLCAAPSYIARRGQPQTLAELAGHDCLLYRERHQTFGVWRLTGPDGPASVRVTGPMGSNHSDIVRNWALDGRGIILLAGWDVAEQLRRGELVRVLPAYHQSADVWAVTAARLDQTVRLKVCLGFLIERLKAGSWALDTTVG